MEDNRIYKTVEEILEGRIRPELGRHGGSIVLVKIEDTVAYIRLTGHCSGCPSAKYTLENLVKEELMRHTDLISDVRLHEEVSQELYDFARDIFSGKAKEDFMKTICYGELMVDMIAETVLAEADCFRRYAGGAAANVAVQLRRLGGESAFLGKLGADAFGDYLLEDLRGCRVDTGAVIRDPVRRTTVAFVGRDEKRIPEYLFYRMGGASDTIVPEEIDQAYLRQAGMLYSSSLMLTTPAVRRTTRWLFGFAKENGIPIAFDLNLRPTAWENVEEARATVEKIFEQIDILKINDEEMSFLLQRDVDPATAGEALLERYPALRVLLLTCGGKGTYLFGRDVGTIYVETHQVKVVDTTGAGDSYMGAFLYACESCGGNMERLEEMGRYAAAAAELTIGARGAIQAMPEKERLDAYCRQQGIPVF